MRRSYCISSNRNFCSEIFYVFSRHIDFMVQMGVPKREAWLAVQELKTKFDLKAHANIYNDVVDTAKMLKLPLVNIHQPCDEYMRTEILNKLNSGRTGYVFDVIRSVEEIPAFRSASARIKLVHGNVRSETVSDSSSIVSSTRFLLNLKQYLLASIYMHVNEMFTKTPVRLQDRQYCNQIRGQKSVRVIFRPLFADTSVIHTLKYQFRNPSSSSSDTLMRIRDTFARTLLSPRNAFLLVTKCQMVSPPRANHIMPDQL